MAHSREENFPQRVLVISSGNNKRSYYIHKTKIFKILKNIILFFLYSYYSCKSPPLALIFALYFTTITMINL